MDVLKAQLLQALLISSWVLTFVLVVGLCSRRVSDKKKFVLWALLAEYLFIVLGVTLLFRSPMPARTIHLSPFWIYSVLGTAAHSDALKDIVHNLLLFLPFGALLAGINPSLKWYKVLLIGLACSLSIEVLQYAFLRGDAQTDDLLHNTVSCLIGWGVVKGVGGSQRRINFK